MAPDAAGSVSPSTSPGLGAAPGTSPGPGPDPGPDPGTGPGASATAALAPPPIADDSPPDPTLARADPLLSRIEDAGINASAPPQQLWIDGWLLRFNPGKAKRARCVQAVAEGRLPLAERLALCRQVMDAAGLPLVVRITPFSQPAGLDDTLASWGWHRLDDTRVMVARPCPEQMPALPPGTMLERLEHGLFAETVGALRRSPESQRQAHALRLRQSPVPYQGFVLRRSIDHAVLACGQTATEADMVGLYDVFTDPAVRGQGLARLLCAALLARAAADGARTAYLQVEADNAPARAIYRRLGFVDGYAYHYRTPQAGAA